MITPRMYQVKYDASLRTVLSNFRFTLWGPAPHHSLKNRIFFWLPARWASGFSGDHQQDHQCLWLLLCYTFILSFIACILLEIKLLLLLLLHWLNFMNAPRVRHTLRLGVKMHSPLQTMQLIAQVLWQMLPQCMLIQLIPRAQEHQIS